MLQTFDNVLRVLRTASNAHDVFGPLPTDGHTALRRRYHELAHVVHPDHNPRRMAEATEAFALLGRWHAAAQRHAARGTDGSATPRISAVTPQHEYVGYAPPINGDLCELFPAEADGMPVLLKVARSPRNNDLLDAEARALRQLAQTFADQPVRAHFPTLIEQFRLRDSARVERRVNVLRAEAGYVTLADVLHAYPGGLPLGDAAWMFNRVLAALGSAHSAGIVHGAVLPPHVLLRPADHNGMLLDWCYSVEAGAPLKAISPAYRALYPPEVSEKRPATPATDLYMAARCMALLLGSGPVPKAFSALLRACLIESPQRCASDAWQVFDDFRELLRQHHGPPVFRPFHMPGNKA